MSRLTNAVHAPLRPLAWATLAFLLTLCGCGKSEEAPPLVADGDEEEEAESELPRYCEDGALGCSGDSKVILCVDGAWKTDKLCEEGWRCQAGLCFIVLPDGDGESEKVDLAEDEIEDLLAPRISSTSPNNGQENVATNVTTVDFNFNEPLDISGFHLAQDFHIKGGCTPVTIVEYVLLDNKRLLRFTIGLLQPGTGYTVSLAGDALKDLAGNLFPAYTLAFKTAGAPPADQDCEDDTPPALLSSDPAAGRSGVSPDLGQVLLTFTEPTRADGYDPSSQVAISGADGHLVSFVSSWPYTDRHALLLSLAENSRPLHAETCYTVNLAAGLRDLAGNTAGALSLTFTTGAILDGDAEAETQDTPETEEETAPVIPESVSLDSTQRSSCLVDQSQYEPGTYPEALVPTFKNGLLTLVHHNAPYAHCLSKFSASLVQNGATVKLYETAQLGTSCDASAGRCPFDVTYTLSGFVAAEYAVELYKAGESTPWRTTFTATARR